MTDHADLLAEINRRIEATQAVLSELIAERRALKHPPRPKRIPVEQIRQTILSALVDGKTLDQVATQIGRKRSTVIWHIREMAERKAEIICPYPEKPYNKSIHRKWYWTWHTETRKLMKTLLANPTQAADILAL